MARNSNDILRWGDIEEAIMTYHAEQTVSKYPSSDMCKVARSAIEGTLYAVEDVPAYKKRTTTDDILREALNRNDKVISIFFYPNGSCSISIDPVEEEKEA